jgi:thioredoxin 1
MSTHKVTDSGFETEVLQSPVPVLVDFWAEWCGPCKALGPLLEDLSEDIKNVKIVKINIDENPQTPQKYRIRSIPTLMVFKGGQPVATKVGALPKNLLAEWIAQSVA